MFQKQVNTLIATCGCPGRQRAGILPPKAAPVAPEALFSPMVQLGNGRAWWLLDLSPLQMEYGGSTQQGSPEKGTLRKADCSAQQVLSVDPATTPFLKGGKDGRSLPCSSTVSCTSISKQREIFLTPLQCIQRKSRDCSETHSEWDWQLLGGGSLPEQKRRSGVWFSLWYYFHSGTQKEESTTL